MKRSDMLQTLDTEFDVVVIGGGITGVGAARDAAYRGLKVALVEMDDLAYGTSSRSSKLVHGGLRYLENFEFGLVFEAVSERRTLMDIAPHLVEPLGFIFPVRKDSKIRWWAPFVAVVSASILEIPVVGNSLLSSSSTRSVPYPMIFIWVLHRWQLS